MSGRVHKKLPIAVLISGTGRSLKNLIDHIKAGTLDCEIKLVVASSRTARGVQYAEKALIPIETIERSQYETKEGFSEAVFQECSLAQVELVVMAGYLKLLHIPESYYNKVVNIHPSLIPSFSGQGFYGDRVHAAAIETGVRVSGCTVHFVNNEYDSGPIILQKTVPVLSTDDTHSLNDRVFYGAECYAYPEALQLIAENRVVVEGHRVRILPPPEGVEVPRDIYEGLPGNEPECHPKILLP